MIVTTVFYLLFVHWIADFVLQTHWQATNKSKDNYALASHVGTYTSTWFIFIFGWLIYNDIDLTKQMLLFIPITFVAHFVTDYITSRITSYLYKKEDFHNFFVIIGFDQLLHYLQIFLTFSWLFL
jgi:hypothetical protein